MKSLFYSVFILCLSLGYTVFSQSVSSVHKTAADCKVSASGGLGCALASIKISSTPVLDAGDNVSSYAWSGPAKFISSVQSPTLTNATTNQSGIYTINIVTVNGCTAIATTSVLVENCLKLGDLVWNDANNNGKKDATETGIAGVTLRLYADNNADEKPDGTALAIMINDANGKYLFTNLSPGKYIVEATPPTGYRSSTGINGSETGPYEGNSPGDNDVDNDDNGTGNPVRSRTITLNNFTESITDGDTDNNTNLTVDFGFYQYDIAADLSTQCSDNTVKLKAIGGSTYAWKGPNNFVSTQQNPILKNVNYRNRGIYTVTIDNTATFTTEVNIKDPVAFTVPKEISVCEGGTLLIEPKSGRLTDSTEVVDYYDIKASTVSYTYGSPLIVNNFSSNEIDNYKVTAYSSKGCNYSQNVNVKINSSASCGIIKIESLEKIKMCVGQETSIPFTIKGDFKQGTKFSVFIVGANYELELLGITEKSPAIVQIPSKFQGNSFNILIRNNESNAIGFASKRAYGTIDKNYINPKTLCDSSQLLLNNTSNITLVNWFLDGKEIPNYNKSTLTVKKSGTYSLKYSINNNRYDIDKTCLYESQPVKIELGKIEKPYPYVENDIELCVGKPAILSITSKVNTNYRWKKDGNYIANATNPSYQTLQEGKYQIEAKEGTCTAVSDTVVLKKPVRLEFNIEPTNSIRGAAINNTYQLCNNQSFDIGISIFSPAISPNTRLQLIKNGIVIKDTISNLIKGIKESGEYFVKANYGTCSGISNTMSIKYDKYIYITSGDKYINTLNACEGNTVGLSFNSERLYNNNIRQVKYSLEKGKIYRSGEAIQDWNFNFGYYDNYFTTNKAGNYYGIGNIKLSDGSTCEIYSDTIRVNFSKKPQNKSYQYDDKLQLTPIISCKDTVLIDTYYYYGASQYGREIAYKWTKDGAILKQDSSRIIQVTQSGTYQLETTYKDGCIVTSSPYKVEFGKIGVNFYGDLTSSICEGKSYNLFSYFSENSDKNVSDFMKDGKSLSMQLQSPYILTQPGTYKLKVTNGKCEGTSPDFTLKVDKIPTSITPSDSVIFCNGKTVELKTSTEAGLSYIWERNGQVVAQANQATLTASTDGLYKATLLRGKCWGTTPSVKLKTLANILPVATLTGDKKIGYDQETKLAVNLSSYAPWTFKLSDGKEYTATKSPFEITVKPSSTTTYNLTEVKNICGTGTVTGTAKIELIILSSEEEAGVNINVYPMPTTEVCNWQIQTEQATTVALTLLNMNGQTQIEQSSPVRSQSHSGTIDLSTMKSGTYFLKINVGEKTITRKIVKF
jgi:SdrD B-like domain/Secretion system C-terminal sorting domain